MTPPDPKPRKRHRATRQEWERLRAAKGGTCRVCGNPNYELHHAVGRDLGGDDVEHNLVPLCSRHHRDVEERRLFIGPLLSDDERRFIRTVKGERFLQRYYDGNLAA